jgi:hypothetical protein
VTRRVGVIIALGFLTVLAAGGLALTIRTPAKDFKPTPSWGMYSNAQWRTLEQRYGAITMRTAMTSAAVVSAHGCLVVLDGMREVATVCHPTKPLQAFAVEHHGLIDVAGVASRRVVSVVTTTPQGSMNSALLPANDAWVFSAGFGRGASGPLTLTARDAKGRVVARLYCASALRGACGMSAHRRS